MVNRKNNTEMNSDTSAPSVLEREQPIDKRDYIHRWVNSTGDDSSVISESEGSVFSSSIVDSEDLGDRFQSSIVLGNTAATASATTVDSSVMSVIQRAIGTSSNPPSLGNIVIENSHDVHVGNVTYINGPIHIIHTGGGSIGSVHQLGSSVKKATGDDEEREEVNTSDAFLGNIPRSVIRGALRFVDRRTWLAQRPLDPYDFIEGAVPYVIISHTATEMASTQADNIYLVRNIQCFHVESRRWNDISYNFLIGGDGNVYEGRGWGAVGAHTLNYNRKSVGISFVGCFMRELPPTVSLDACKLLIKRGVELGHIAPDYKLLAHCQCSPTESPGRKLFEELQTWEHFSRES